MAKYSTEKLKKAIKDKFGTVASFAEASGLEPSTVSRLLVRGDWKASQMKSALEALDIPLSEVGVYFFDEERAISQPHEVTT